jgi:hypothetical protein
MFAKIGLGSQKPKKNYFEFKKKIGVSLERPPGQHGTPTSWLLESPVFPVCNRSLTQETGNC